MLMDVKCRGLLCYTPRPMLPQKRNAAVLRRTCVAIFIVFAVSVAAVEAVGGTGRFSSFLLGQLTTQSMTLTSPPNGATAQPSTFLRPPSGGFGGFSSDGPAQGGGAGAGGGGAQGGDNGTGQKEGGQSDGGIPEPCKDQPSMQGNPPACCCNGPDGLICLADQSICQDAVQKENAQKNPQQQRGQRTQRTQRQQTSQRQQQAQKRQAQQRQAQQKQRQSQPQQRQQTSRRQTQQQRGQTQQRATQNQGGNPRTGGDGQRGGAQRMDDDQNGPQRGGVQRDDGADDTGGQPQRQNGAQAGQAGQRGQGGGQCAKAREECASCFPDCDEGKCEDDSEADCEYSYVCEQEEDIPGAGPVCLKAKVSCEPSDECPASASRQSRPGRSSAGGNASGTFAAAGKSASRKNASVSAKSARSGQSASAKTSVRKSDGSAASAISMHRSSLSVQAGQPSSGKTSKGSSRAVTTQHTSAASTASRGRRFVDLSGVPERDDGFCLVQDRDDAECRAAEDCDDERVVFRSERLCETFIEQSAPEDERDGPVDLSGLETVEGGFCLIVGDDASHCRDSARQDCEGQPAVFENRGLCQAFIAAGVPVPRKDSSASTVSRSSLPQDDDGNPFTTVITPACVQGGVCLEPSAESCQSGLIIADMQTCQELYADGPGSLCGECSNGSVCTPAICDVLGACVFTESGDCVPAE